MKRFMVIFLLLAACSCVPWVPFGCSSGAPVPEGGDVSSPENNPSSVPSDTSGESSTPSAEMPSGTPPASGTTPEEEPGLDASRIAAWDFNSPAELGKDITGNGHNGVVEGDAASNSVDNALCLDGDGDYLRIPYDVALSPSAALTVSAWVKPASVSHPMFVLSNALYYLRGYDIAIAATTMIPWFSVHSDWTQWGNMSSAALSADAWHHLAAVYYYDQSLHGGSGGFVSLLYVDGEEKGRNDPVGMHLGLPYSVDPHLLYAPKNELLIGYGDTKNLPAGTYYFQGCIDNVVLYNKKLSSSEIQGLFQQKPSTP